MLKKYLLWIIGFSQLLLVACLGNRFANADGTDLKSFLYDPPTFSDGGYEPLFGIFQLFFQLFTWHSSMNFIPSLIVAVALCYFIFSSSQGSFLKCFWVIVLIAPLSLINFRMGTLFFAMTIIPLNPIYYGFFIHWTYFFLLISSGLDIKRMLAVALAFAVLNQFLIELFYKAVDKSIHYFNYDFSSRWGWAVYFEILFLLIVYYKLYYKSSNKISTQVLILSTALLCQFFSVNVVASRLTLLSLCVSLIELKDKPAIKLSIFNKILLFVIALYQFARFSVNIPETNIKSFFEY